MSKEAIPFKNNNKKGKNDQDYVHFFAFIFFILFGQNSTEKSPCNGLTDGSGMSIIPKGLGIRVFYHSCTEHCIIYVMQIIHITVKSVIESSTLICESMLVSMH